MSEQQQRTFKIGLVGSEKKFASSYADFVRYCHDTWTPPPSSSSSSAKEEERSSAPTASSFSKISCVRLLLDEDPSEFAAADASRHYPAPPSPSSAPPPTQQRPLFLQSLVPSKWPDDLDVVFHKLSDELAILEAASLFDKFADPRGKGDACPFSELEVATATRRISQFKAYLAQHPKTVVVEPFEAVAITTHRTYVQKLLQTLLDTELKDLTIASSSGDEATEPKEQSEHEVEKSRSPPHPAVVVRLEPFMEIARASDRTEALSRLTKEIGVEEDAHDDEPLLVMEKSDVACGKRVAHHMRAVALPSEIINTQDDEKEVSKNNNNTIDTPSLNQQQPLAAPSYPRIVQRIVPNSPYVGKIYVLGKDKVWMRVVRNYFPGCATDRQDKKKKQEVNQEEASSSSSSSQWFASQAKDLFDAVAESTLLEDIEESGSGSTDFPPALRDPKVLSAVRRVSQAIIQATGLTLFGFDIVPCMTGSSPEGGEQGGVDNNVEDDGGGRGGRRVQYFTIIDINYYPGYKGIKGLPSLVLAHVFEVWRCRRDSEASAAKPEDLA